MSKTRSPMKEVPFLDSQITSGVAGSCNCFLSPHPPALSSANSRPGNVRDATCRPHGWPRGPQIRLDCMAGRVPGRQAQPLIVPGWLHTPLHTFPPPNPCPHQARLLFPFYPSKTSHYLPVAFPTLRKTNLFLLFCFLTHRSLPAKLQRVPGFFLVAWENRIIPHSIPVHR